MIEWEDDHTFSFRHEAKLLRYDIESDIISQLTF